MTSTEAFLDCISRMAYYEGASEVRKDLAHYMFELGWRAAKRDSVGWKVGFAIAMILLAVVGAACAYFGKAYVEGLP